MQTVARPVSRRTVLQGVGAGVAVAALGGTQARAATLGATAQPAWTWTGGNGLPLVAAFTTGTVVLAQNGPTSGLTATVTGIDIRTGSPLWTSSVPRAVQGQVVAVQASADAVVVAGFTTRNQITCFDPGTGASRWTAMVEGFPWAENGQITRSVRTPPIAIGAGAVFVLSQTLAGFLTAFDATTGAQLWRARLPGTANDRSWTSTPIVGPGFVAVIVNNVFLYVFDPATGAQLGSTTRLPYAVSNQPVLLGDRLYTAYHAGPAGPSPNGVAAFSVRDPGTQLWLAPNAPSQVAYSAPTLAGGLLLVGDSGGHVTAFDPTTGATAWQTTVGTADLSGARILAEDGIAYLVGSTTAGPRLYGLDLANRDVSRFTTGMRQPLLVGVESGVCYYAETVGNPPRGGLLAGGVDLAAVLHGFFGQSTLMADGYVQATTRPDGVTPASPTWRSHLQLLDATGTPRVRKAVRVWTDTAATITSGGKSYTVGPKQPAWLATDAAGELAIAVDAASSPTAASGRGIGCAALYVWGNFMERGEAIVLYPDHDTLVGLSTVQGTALTTATAYDGTPLLPAAWTPANADQLAQTIRATMGAAGASLAAAQKRPVRGRRRPGAPAGSAVPGASPAGGYIAFPASSPNLLYQPVIGSTTRAWTPSAVPAWSATFTGSTVAFTPGAVPGARRPPRAGSIFTDFERFLAKVVHGVDRIARIVWQGIRSVAQTIETAAGDVYRLVIDTVEKASAVVAGIVKAAVGDVERLVEALSVVLSWGTVVDVHQQMVTTVTGGMRSLATWATNVAGGGGVPAFFDGAATTLAADFAQVEGLLAGRSVVRSSGAGANPDTVYGIGGARSYTPTRWMTEKVKQNIGQAGVPSGAAAGSGFATAVQGLFTGLGTQVEQDFATLPADLRALFDDVGALARDPSRFGAVALADVLRVVADIAVGVVRLAGSASQDVLAALPALVDGVLAALTAPIEVPFLSDLYRWIAEAPLSILDLVCLVVAIPTAIVQRTLASGAVAFDRGLAGVMALAVFACFDPINEAFTAALQSFPLGFSLLEAASAALVLGLGFPTDLATNTTIDYVFWAFQLLPIVLLVVGALGPDPATLGGLVYLLVASLILTFYGIGMLATAITLGAKDASWRGKDGLLLAQNVTSVVPNLLQLGLLGDAASVVTITVDAVCDIGATALAAARLVVSS